MMSRFSTPRLWRMLACAALVGVVPAGCVEDIGVIDRTSPDKVDKTSFEGVWIMMNTTVDAPFSTAISFAGEQNFGGGQKVIFDIQEDWLVAYPVVETVEGSEADWKTNSIRKYWDKDARDEFVEMYTAQPAARWPITKHFDVKRNYNTFNGSQSNELTENTNDRHWYERDYIRVAWNKQQVRPFFFSIAGGSDADSYFVGDQSPDEPDSIVFEDGYFDYTTRLTVSAYGQRACSIYGLSPYDCASAEVRVRNSFMRLDHRRDYEPLRYHNDEHQDRFGYFLTERPYYDSDWGPSYKGSVSWINRWNLWRTSYDFTKPVNADNVEQTVDCFIDDDCNADNGERCHKEESWFSNGYCAIATPKPYRERGLRPVLYHLNADWHPDYISAAYLAADNWSDVFKDAVAWLYYYEDKGLSTTRACETHSDCANEHLLADAMVRTLDQGVTCHSDLDCGSATCGADNYCAQVRSCSAASPCAQGQMCTGGVCMLDGQQVSARIQTSLLRGSTLVYSTADANVVTHDNFSTRLRNDLPSGYAYVRLVHLAPGEGSVGLAINGETALGGEYDANRDYDPQDPATQSFMVAVPAGSAVSVAVTRGGADVASTTADIVANAQYLAIYNGTDVVVAGASFGDSGRGIRFVHAGVGEGPLDFAIQGVRFESNVPYQSSTGYFTSAGDVQRATASRSGQRGDITCYESDTIGRCVGWSAAFTDADKDRVRQIKAELPEMFVLCRNTFDAVAASQTVPDADKATFYGDARYTRADNYNPCGDSTLVANPAEPKRIGDLRYSYFYWVNEPQRSGPLGYGPSVADPDTGQIINGVANIYGGAIHTYSRYARDLLDLVNGDLDTEDIITGAWIREYMDSQDGDDNVDPDEATFYGALEAGQATGGEMDSHGERVERAHFGVDEDTHVHGQHAGLAQKLFHGKRLQAPKKQFQDYEFRELYDLMADREKFSQAMYDSVPKVDPKLFHNRLNKVRGTMIDDLMINDEIASAAAHIDPTGEMNYDEMRDALSPATWSSKWAMQKEQERTQLLAKNNMYMGEFIDDALFGLARDLKARGVTGDEMTLEIGRAIMAGVLEHEIGHTIGLRHNFSGSTDVFNFHDEYYSIREKELILCQDDSWCDDVNGAACAIKECSADTDCVAGTLCDAGTCAAPGANNSAQLVATGVCSTPLADLPPCTADAQCGDGMVCFEQRCYEPRQQFVPRPWMTDLEKAGRRTEFQYTTTMDYGGRINSDIRGLGKYDYAAVRFGYTRLVDVYNDVSNIDRRINNTAQLVGTSPATYSFYKNARFWPTRGTGVFHAFNYLSNYIGVEQNLDRRPVPYDQVKYQSEMAVNDVREYLDLEYVEVPYAMCSDEYRGNMGCYYFDIGIDPGEMAAGATVQLEQYYIFDAFKRERLFYGMYGNPMSYYGRIMDRYMRVLGDVGMYYALYDNFLFRYSWYENWKSSPLGGRTLEQSAIDAFATLKDVVAAPAPGSYKFDSDMDAYVNISLSPGAEGADFDVPFGIGRFPYTQFGGDLGYNYYEHPLWFGSFWEKLGALVTLADSTAYFADTAVGEQLNIGVGTSLGFNTVFSAEMNNFMGGLIAQQLDFYAGRAIQGRYVPPSISARNLQDTPVEPALNNFTLKLYAAVYGLAFLPAGFDPQFIDRLAVFVEGEATQYQADAAVQIPPFRWEDPIGGKVYLAYGTNYGDFGEPKIDVAAELVTRAADLTADWANETDPGRKAEYQKQMSDIRDILDVLRRLNHIYGTSTLGL